MIFSRLSLNENTTFRIGPEVESIECQRESELEKAVSLLKDKFKNDWFVLGRGSCILVDENWRGGVLRLKGEFNKISLNSLGLIEAGGGVLLKKIFLFAKEQALSGLERLADIPGTAGGALVTEAAAFGESIKNIATKVKIFFVNDLKSYWLSIKDLEGIKEKIIILKAVLKLIKSEARRIQEIYIECNKKRKETQPLNLPSCGCIFKNPPELSAGYLIEKANLKGKSIGGAMVSPIHANFIVNYNDASFNDVMSLIKLIQKEVKEKFGISLELKIRVIHKESV